MEIFSPGKINLALNVGRVRPDGYHPVDSVFHMIEFGDIVSLHPAEHLSVTCTYDLGISQEDNLVYKAAKMFDATFNTVSHFAIHIEKHLKAGGGLGGGSSNAAAVLYALCIIHNVRATDAQLLALAASLGSDVPVFLAPTGASLMTNRGEKLARSLVPAAGVPLVIAWPQNAHSNTGEVYRAFDDAPVATKSMANLCDYLDLIVPQKNGAASQTTAMSETEAGTEAEAKAEAKSKSDSRDNVSFAPQDKLIAMQAHFLAGELYNNLSEAAIRVTPEVGDVLLNLLAQPQTLGATVSGSGACSFAITASNDDAQKLAEQCKAAGFGAFATKLRSRGVAKINGIESLYE